MQKQSNTALIDSLLGGVIFGGVAMINRISHKYKKIWILLIALLIFLFAIILIYNSYILRKRHEEHTVIAQEYLDAGDFEEAQEAYQKALAMKYGDKELLSLGLADAFAGAHNYDKALEVLRSIYEVNKTTAVKEKIEEITIKKTDYSFNQQISFGDTFFSNGEYNKAIDEYEKAKQIKGKSDIPYIKIVESFMALERYDLAYEEIEEGLALTESMVLDSKLSTVEALLKEIKYDEILLSAEEYIYQENYEDAISSFNEAIRLIPERDAAYNHMAELYITQEEYYTAKALLQNYLRSNSSSASMEILNRADDLITQINEKERVLNELYTALSVVDIYATINILENDFFINIIAEEAPFYYSPTGDMNLAWGYGVLISDKNTIYVGGFKNGMREGIGVQFVRYDDAKDLSWYYYQGEWVRDIPNGIGKTEEERLEKDANGVKQAVRIQTSGMFWNGLENGAMHKTFYADGVEKSVYYSVDEGFPKLYIDEDSQLVQAVLPNHYVIGRIYINNEPSEEYYSIKQGTIFKIKFLND